MKQLGFVNSLWENLRTYLSSGYEPKTRQLIDFSQAYSKTHHKSQIETALQQFETHFGALINFDKKMLTTGVGASSLLWITGISTVSSNIILCLGAYLLICRQQPRIDLENQAHQSLEYLVDIYNWCSKQEKITEDDLFCQLFETIAPHLENGDINLKSLLSKGISESFAGCLGKFPHLNPFIPNKKSNRNGWIKLFDKVAPHVWQTVYAYELPIKKVKLG